MSFETDRLLAQIQTCHRIHLALIERRNYAHNLVEHSNSPMQFVVCVFTKGEQIFIDANGMITGVLSEAAKFTTQSKADVKFRESSGYRISPLFVVAQDDLRITLEAIEHNKIYASDLCDEYVFAINKEIRK